MKINIFNREICVCALLVTNSSCAENSAEMEKMMDNLIHIGFGNIVNTGKLIAIVSPDSAPIKRMVQRAKENGMVVDAAQGRRTKAVLVMENGQLVLSALLPETIAGRAQTAPDGARRAGEDEIQAESGEEDDE